MLIKRKQNNAQKKDLHDIKARNNELQSEVHAMHCFVHPAMEHCLTNKSQNSLTLE